MLGQVANQQEQEPVVKAMLAAKPAAKPAEPAGTAVW
jgi:hypothetical protein